MAGFIDLVDQAQPALYGGGCTGAATEGRTWRWGFTEVNDLAGDPIDLTTVTGVCKVLTAVGGEEIIELTFTGTVGAFHVSADSADTVALATNAGADPLVGVWSLVLSDGVNSVQAWGPTKSRFAIFTED